MAQALFHFFILQVFQYLTAVLCALVSEKRLFWLDLEVKPHHFNLHFAAPDVELASFTCLITTLFLGYYHEVGQPPRFGGAMCTGYIIKIFVMGLLGTIFIGIVVSSAYLGQLSFQASIFTISLSVLFGSYMHFHEKMYFILLPLEISRGNEDTKGNILRSFSAEEEDKRPAVDHVIDYSKFHLRYWTILIPFAL